MKDHFEPRGQFPNGHGKLTTTSTEPRVLGSSAQREYCRHREKSGFLSIGLWIPRSQRGNSECEALSHPEGIELLDLHVYGDAKRVYNTASSGWAAYH